MRVIAWAQARPEHGSARRENAEGVHSIERVGRQANHPEIPGGISHASLWFFDALHFLVACSLCNVCELLHF